MLRRLCKERRERVIAGKGAKRETSWAKGEGGEEGRQNRDDPGRERTCTGSSFVPVHFWTCVGEKRERKRDGERKKNGVYISRCIPAVSEVEMLACARRKMSFYCQEKRLLNLFFFF